MPAITMLVLIVAPLFVVVGLLLVGGLGYVVYRRPALTQPVGIAIAAAGVLVAVVVGIVQVTTS